MGAIFEANGKFERIQPFKNCFGLISFIFIRVDRLTGFSFSNFLVPLIIFIKNRIFNLLTYKLQ